MLFSSRVRVRIRFSVWLDESYAHIFVLLPAVIVTLICEPLCKHVEFNITLSIVTSRCAYICINYKIGPLTHILLNLRTLEDTQACVGNVC